MLLAMLGVLCVGNPLTALATSLPVILAARLAMGFANGVFWAIGVSVAWRLVARTRGPGGGRRAVRNLDSGGARHSRWHLHRRPVELARNVRDLERPQRDRRHRRDRHGAIISARHVVPLREVLRLPLRNRRLRVVLATVTLFPGHHGAYTFVRPWLESRADVTPGALSLMFVAFGFGGAVGNVLAGQILARAPRATLLVGCGSIAVSLLVLLGLRNSTIGVAIALGAWGVALGASNLSQVALLVRAAPAEFEAAMSINTMAYNVAISLGALLGGAVAAQTGLDGPLRLGIGLGAAATLGAVCLMVARDDERIPSFSGAPHPMAHQNARTVVIERRQAGWGR